MVKKNKNKEIAKDRINYLFNLLRDNLNDYEFSKNIINMIYRLKQKFNIRLTQNEKEVFCKKCLKPYINPKIRFKIIIKNKEKFLQKKIICEFCNYEKKFSFKIR